MKMKAEHFEQLRLLINNSPAPQYDHPVSEKRMRWDRLWSVPYTARENWFRENNIYGYLNDDHIDATLRNITLEG